MNKIGKKSNHYVNNKAFYDSIVEYKKAYYQAEKDGSEPPQIPDDCAANIMLIAKHLAVLPKFNKYSYVDEMVSDAIMNCIRYFHRFDEKKFNNPHAYFTQICSYAFVNRINIEKKDRYLIYKSFEKDIVLPGKIDNDSFAGYNDHIHDNISGYIDDWETRHEEKKKAKKHQKKKKQSEMKNSLERLME